MTRVIVGLADGLNALYARRHLKDVPNGDPRPVRAVQLRNIRVDRFTQVDDAPILEDPDGRSDHRFRHGRDNGPEFTGQALDAWAYRRDVKIEFLRPGQPVENCFIESFNGSFRDECLYEHWFTGLADA